MSLVVIMAGGRGLRLHPLTESRPKPMLEIGQKPILQIIVEGFRDQGFSRFVFCVHYRAEVIERHFGDGKSLDVDIGYIHEKEPLGTAGALGLLPPQERPIIVQNGDILADLDYRALYKEHEAHGSLATMALAYHQYQVPYGVIEVDAAFVRSIKEKPIEAWAVNAGIYVLSPKLLREIKGRCDMPDVLAQAEGFTRYYQITGDWRDIGTFASLEQERMMRA